MAIITNWYTMDGKEGVDLNNVLPANQAGAASFPEYPRQPHALGDRVQGNGGSEWMFVIASATITAFNCIAITNSFSAIVASASVGNLLKFNTLALAQWQTATPGSATVNNGVANSGDFFWALIKANAGVRVNVTASVSVAGGNPLYLSPTANGQFTTSACASNRVNGLFTPTSATSANDSAGSYTITEVGMFMYMMPADAISIMSF